MRKLVGLLAVLAVLALSGASAALAGEAGGQKEDAESRIPELIRQLGDEAWDKREAASKALEKIGRPALPALRKAAESEDAEVSARAKRLIEKIAPAPRPGKAVRVPAAGGLPAIRVQGGGRLVIGKGANALVIAPPKGQNLKIYSIRSDEGIATVTEMGKRISVQIKPEKKGAKTRSYTAGDRAEFRKKHRAVFLKYLATDEEKKQAAKEDKAKAAAGKTEKKEPDEDKARAKARAEARGRTEAARERALLKTLKKLDEQAPAKAGSDSR